MSSYVPSRYDLWTQRWNKLATGKANIKNCHPKYQNKTGAPLWQLLWEEEPEKGKDKSLE